MTIPTLARVSKWIGPCFQCNKAVGSGFDSPALLAMSITNGAFIYVKIIKIIQIKKN